MAATLVLSRTGIDSDPAMQWGNFATNLHIRQTELDETQSPLSLALQNWSKLIFAQARSNADLWRVADKDRASSVTSDASDTNISIGPLVSFLDINDVDRKQNKEVLIAAAEEGMKPLLVVSELFKSFEERPDAYTLNTGEMTLDYHLANANVSCVFNDDYFHVLSFKNSEMQDRYFEGQTYTISAVRGCFADLLNQVK